MLLVEDEDAVRMGGVRALQSRGYTVHEAASGVEALEVLEELNGQVDIVVSDVVMPEMDGPTLLRELRKTHQTSSSSLFRAMQKTLLHAICRPMPSLDSCQSLSLSSS